MVDDDPGILDVLEQALDAEGYRVLMASNGRDALDRVAGEPPDVMLVDLMMPVMDGWQFRVEQLKDPLLAAVPVIVVSADARAAKQAARMGAADYLQKPFEFERLVEVVARHE